MESDGDVMTQLQLCVWLLVNCILMERLDTTQHGAAAVWCWESCSYSLLSCIGAGMRAEHSWVIDQMLLGLTLGDPRVNTP